MSQEKYHRLGLNQRDDLGYAESACVEKDKETPYDTSDYYGGIASEARA